MCLHNSWRIVVDDSYIWGPVSLGQHSCAEVLKAISQLRVWYSCYILRRANSMLTVLGWLTVAGWTAAIASTSFFTSSIIQALIVQGNPEYQPTGWQGTLLMWAVLLMVLLFNTVLGSTLPAIEVLILVIHVLGFFAILIPLLYLSPKGNASDVFTKFLNNGGWNTKSLSFFVGLSGNAAALVGKLDFSTTARRLMIRAGADGAVHVRVSCHVAH